MSEFLKDIDIDADLGSTFVSKVNGKSPSGGDIKVDELVSQNTFGSAKIDNNAQLKLTNKQYGDILITAEDDCYFETGGVTQVLSGGVYRIKCDKVYECSGDKILCESGHTVPFANDTSSGGCLALVPGVGWSPGQPITGGTILKDTYERSLFYVNNLDTDSPEITDYNLVSGNLPTVSRDIVSTTKNVETKDVVKQKLQSEDGSVTLEVGNSGAKIKTVPNDKFYVTFKSGFAIYRSISSDAQPVVRFYSDTGVEFVKEEAVVGGNRFWIPSTADDLETALAGFVLYCSANEKYPTRLMYQTTEVFNIEGASRGNPTISSSSFFNGYMTGEFPTISVDPVSALNVMTMNTEYLHIDEDSCGTIGICAYSGVYGVSQTNRDLRIEGNSVALNAYSGTSTFGLKATDQGVTFDFLNLSKNTEGSTGGQTQIIRQYVGSDPGCGNVFNENSFRLAVSRGRIADATGTSGYVVFAIPVT